MAKENMIASKEMRALEVNAEYFGVSRLQLMENAGKSVAAEIASRFKPDKTRVAVFCGTAEMVETASLQHVIYFHTALKLK
jgi:NAD(P)H-hydrate repair Nnr-like enzyme with NAD(P)H-hydrate epimerase domain